MPDREAALRAFLAKAEAVLKDGEFAEAERGFKAVSALAKAERDIADLVASESAVNAEIDEEAVRAELRRRLVAYADADGAGAAAEVLDAIAMGEPVQ